MEFLAQYKKYGFVLAAVVVGAVGLLAVGINRPTDAQSSTSQPPKQSNGATTNNASGQAQTTQAAYSYTAQPGDAYSWMARKAVQTYGLVNNVKLTQAQIVAAETRLASNAGFPLLNAGQAVNFVSNDVKAAVDSAKKLTAQAQAAWQPYVVVVNFNTNQVGQRR